MYGKNDVDCEKCHYGASGGQTIVCCNYGGEECDPFGQCTQFEDKKDGRINMFDTVGDAVRFAKIMGEVDISPADKNLFKFAAAIDIAYNKGRLEVVSERIDPDSIAELEECLRIGRACLREHTRAL